MIWPLWRGVALLFRKEGFFWQIFLWRYKIWMIKNDHIYTSCTSCFKRFFKIVHIFWKLDVFLCCHQTSELLGKSHLLIGKRIRWWIYTCSFSFIFTSLFFILLLFSLASLSWFCCYVRVSYCTKEIDQYL